MPVMLQTTLLLVCSNVFMTFAWYAHLKDMSGRPWFIAALAEWLAGLGNKNPISMLGRICHGDVPPLRRRAT